jgi:hypothetical protein
MAVIDDNLAGVRDRVRRWLHEVNPDSSFWSDKFIDQMINVTYRRRCSQLVMAFEGYFTNVATRDLTADQERYAHPPGHERTLKVEIVRTDGTTSPIERFERHFSSNNPNQGTGIDSYTPTWRSLSGGLILEPAPGETVVDGLRIEYYGLPALLQNDNDSFHVDFPRSMDELVVLDAVVACMDSENQLETGNIRTAQRMRAEWEQDFARYIDNRLFGTNKIIPFNPHYSDA